MRSNFVFGLAKIAAAAVVLMTAAGLATGPAAAQQTDVSKYVIGPGDMLQVSVWHNPELSTSVPVRPDGRISTPLVSDVVAAGKTSEQLGHDIEAQLKKYVADPIVTVMISNFVGPYSQQVRIVGEASTPKALPYLAHMTVLDAMIAAGGLTPYASGNRAKLVRRVGGKETETTVRISDLLKDGDLSANTELQPGDIIIIPQSFF
jgi:polysaccharide export outer membrane protein